MNIGKSMYYYSHTPPLGEGCARTTHSPSNQPPNKTKAPAATPFKAHSPSGRFICEATNHISGRF